MEYQVNDFTLTPLKVILNAKGNIYHALKCTESSYISFGEAYFSEIKCDEIKGWKKHTKMTLNLIVPIGNIKFVLYNKLNQKFYEIIIGEDNYQRLTIPPNIWVAFKGLNIEKNLLLNIANMPHDPNEAINLTLDSILYEWK
jgi:dTDP-4-dehydrorhamnose 3,5-epimerase